MSKFVPTTSSRKVLGFFWKNMFRKTATLLVAASLASCASNKQPEIDEAFSDIPVEMDSEVAETSAEDIRLTDEETSKAQSEEVSKAKLSEDLGSVLAAGSFPVSRRPDVAATPFRSGEFVLNAFYFVRGADETYSSISQKLYGRSDRADLVKGWNNSVRLKPGALLYYNSALRPVDETAMKPFVEDMGGQLTTVEVQKGDTLSVIAQRMYGSPALWREIAALNEQIEKPDQIEVGTVLRVQPDQFDSSTAIAAVSQGVPVTTSAPVVSAPETSQSGAVEFTDDQASVDASVTASPVEVAAGPESPVVAAAPAEAEQPEEFSEEVVQSAPKAAQKSSGEDAGVLSVLFAGDESSNLLLGGLSLLTLALLIIVVNRRRAAKKQAEQETKLSNLGGQ